ncbi:MAG: replicative DNA helicase [Verrucomicrobiota bacterium]|nr:replicative DNA helicase [Verrucomicrobiota bacterium]
MSMIDSNDGLVTETSVEDLAQLPRSAQARSQPSVDRSPPHSIEAEQGVLGCLLLDPNEGLNTCLEKLKEPRQLEHPKRENGRFGNSNNSGTTFFYELKHQVIFESMLNLHEVQQGIDLITLKQYLADKKQLEAVGGVAYLSILMNSVPSAANLEYYFNIVWDKYLLRKTVRTCTEIVREAYEHEGEVDRLLDEVESRIQKINEERAGEAASTMKDLVGRAISRIEAFHERQGGLSGLSTGFLDFDKMTDGLHEAEMVVIAARPSMGKTSLAMNIVEHVALQENVPVGVFSLEMTAESLVTRMICSHARLNFKNLRDGLLGGHDFQRITQTAGKLHKAPLFIDDTPGLSILQLRAKARRMRSQHGVKLIVIDYLQLLHSTSRRASDNRQQEVAEISSGIKSLAKELSVPVIVLCQLNREMEREKNRKPRLSDLRESGSIEQDADLVGLLYKAYSEDEDGPAVEESDGLPINLLLAKQRNGPTGDVPMVFLKQFTRFETAARVDHVDVPND